jgi:predicted negative regulator of RcsB-dependent stress response
MSAGEIGFLALAISAITLFGGVLGWASWMEGRANKRKRQASARYDGTSTTTPDLKPHRVH